MSDPTPSPQTPDATLISSPPGEVPTHSSLTPQEHTSRGESKVPALDSGVVDVGSQLGPYKLVDKLGEGGMGAVYKARHTKLGKFVAMKILPPHVMSRSDALARFEREMLAVGSLHHPNIVQAHDAGEIGGVHYLSMEYVEGQDLQQFVKAKGPMSVVNACKAIRQAAQGLAAAHKLGLVHRDIKPSNLFVAKQSGQIKILDMGLALLSQEEVPAALTSTGQCFGTPDYMAPEQWNDAHTCDARADLYSLGCTLFFLLVGHPPYHSETHRTAANKMKGHVIDPIPDLIAARSDIPDALNAIYRKLMAKDPKDRFASADQLAEALAPFTRQGKPAPSSPESSPHAPREESSTISGTSRRTNSDAAPTQTNASLAPAIVSRSETATMSEPPADQLGATSTWAGSSNAAASRSTGSSQAEAGPQAAAPRRPNRNRLFIAGGAAAFVLLLGVIIITITNNDGSKTKIEVPGDAKVEITTKGDEDSTKTGWHGWPADAPKPAIAPFNAEQAKKHQEEWAAYLKVPVEYTNSIGMKFRLIPPGEFMMGSTADEIKLALIKANPVDKHLLDCIRSEAPKHVVVLTNAVYVGVCEVTQREYSAVVGENPSHFTEAVIKDKLTNDKTNNFPVDSVSWLDATQFSTKLSQKEGLKPVYLRENETVVPQDGTGYRLLTEAEWEFSCRAGTTTRYWSGDIEADLEQVGWYRENSSQRMHAVAELKPNAFGLYDVHGNIWEWVADGVENAWEPSSYNPYKNTPAVNPFTSFLLSARCVLRGGFWDNDAFLSRSASRVSHAPTARTNFIGFRLSLPAEAVRQALKAKGPELPKAAASDSKPSPAGWHGWPADAPKPAIAPFNADQARQHQEAWAKYLNVPVEYTNSIGMKFRLIPPGEFLMGMRKEEAEAIAAAKPGNVHWQMLASSSFPRHTVRITHAFFLGATEVTQEQYTEVARESPSHFGVAGAGRENVVGLNTAQHPVESVSWNDAARYCIKLSELQQLEPAYQENNGLLNLLQTSGYRLPTEAEWELACRAGSVTSWFHGDQQDQLPTVAWYDINSNGRTHPVGRLTANPYGLLDTHGNVWEWCEDWHRVQAYAERGNRIAENPVGSGQGWARSLRGGVWAGQAADCRSAFRGAAAVDHQDSFIGFRVALPIDAVRQALKVTGPAMPQSMASNTRSGIRETSDGPPSTAPSDTDRSLTTSATNIENLRAKFTNSLGMEFVKVPKGTGWLGGGGGKPGERKVEFTDDFYLGKYEVTQEEWEKVTSLNPSRFSRNGDGSDAVKAVSDADLKRFPVESVSWDDCQLFIERLNTQANETGWVYRLPKEDEWEYACRGGPVDRSQSVFDVYLEVPSNELRDGQANFGRGDSGRTCAVGSYKPNTLGLHDMHGNVHVWCHDRVSSPDGLQSDSHRVLRGGSYWSDSSFCRATSRFIHEPSYKHSNVGLRLARVRAGTAQPKQ